MSPFGHFEHFCFGPPMPHFGPPGHHFGPPGRRSSPGPCRGRDHGLKFCRSDRGRASFGCGPNIEFGCPCEEFRARGPPGCDTRRGPRGPQFEPHSHDSGEESLNYEGHRDHNRRHHKRHGGPGHAHHKEDRPRGHCHGPPNEERRHHDLCHRSKSHHFGPSGRHDRGDESGPERYHHGFGPFGTYGPHFRPKRHPVGPWSRQGPYSRCCRNDSEESGNETDGRGNKSRPCCRKNKDLNRDETVFVQRLLVEKAPRCYSV